MNEIEQIKVHLETIEEEALKTVVALSAMKRGEIDTAKVIIDRMEGATKTIHAAIKLRVLLGVPLKSEGSNE